MLLSDVVAAATDVAATRSRTAKIERIAGLLRALAPDEIEPAIAFLAGEPRQGKIGIGWATLVRVQVGHAHRPTLTILDVDEMLSLIQLTTGKGSGDRRGMLLSEFLERATQAESEFLRRLLVGELRQGALEGVATEAIAKAAGVPSGAVRRALMLSGDMSMTARIAFAEGERGLADVQLHVLRPVQPMLASSADGIVPAVEATGESSVEWKLDGIRIQAHRLDDNVRIFSRNLNDITARVPEVVAAVRRLPFATAVLDGEAIALGTDAAVAPYFFDVLHADGQDLLDLPLSERAATIARIPQELRIRSMTTSDPVAAAAFMDEALAAGHEGVMVKALGSAYQAGRRGNAWLKVKPTKTLDLVILAAEWGHGRRSGMLSNLHLGARVPSGGFVMVGKTFKGMTDEMLRWQTEKLQSIETSRDAHTVFVRPEIVVEIAVDSAQRSTRYAGGVALRFARVKRYREDKSPADADLLDAVRALIPG